MMTSLVARGFHPVIARYVCCFFESKVPWGFGIGGSRYWASWIGRFKIGLRIVIDFVSIRKDDHCLIHLTFYITCLIIIGQNIHKSNDQLNISSAIGKKSNKWWFQNIVAFHIYIYTYICKQSVNYCVKMCSYRKNSLREFFKVNKNLLLFSLLFH